MRPGKERRRGRIQNVKTSEGYISEAMACHPTQSREFNEAYKKAGITGAEHLEDGSLHIRSRRARAEIMKMRNMRDSDAGYGDHPGS
jgi:hypothetical protein